MIFFDEGVEVGNLKCKDGKWSFEGDMEESAKLFMDMVTANLPNPEVREKEAVREYIEVNPISYDLDEEDL